MMFDAFASDFPSQPALPHFGTSSCSCSCLDAARSTSLSPTPTPTSIQNGQQLGSPDSRLSSSNSRHRVCSKSTSSSKELTVLAAPSWSLFGRSGEPPGSPLPLLQLPPEACQFLRGSANGFFALKLSTGISHKMSVKCPRLFEHSANHPNTKRPCLDHFRTHRGDGFLLPGGASKLVDLCSVQVAHPKNQPFDT